MDITSQIVPAIVILAANLLSGPHSSLRWETVTAVFGWVAAISPVVFILTYIFFPESSVTMQVGQIGAFCMITALSRDYERILRPLFPWNK